jgi:hypothetical protein
VDYRSLKKGNLAELLNLFHLEGAVFHLTRIKANGLAGFAGIAKSIGDVWIPRIFFFFFLPLEGAVLLILRIRKISSPLGRIST